MWFDEGGALQVADEARGESALQGFEAVPDLLRIVHHVGLAPADDRRGVGGRVRARARSARRAQEDLALRRRPVRSRQP